MNDESDKDSGIVESGNSGEPSIPSIVKDVLDTPIPDGGTRIKAGQK